MISCVRPTYGSHRVLGLVHCLGLSLVLSVIVGDDWAWAQVSSEVRLVPRRVPTAGGNSAWVAQRNTLAAPNASMPQASTASGTMAEGGAVLGGFGPEGFEGEVSSAACEEGSCAPDGARRFCPWEGRFEALLWWTKGDSIFPLVTTGALPSEVLFGGGSLNTEMRAGPRITLDYWLGPCGCAAIEGSYFHQGGTTDYYVDSSTYPVLARPYLDADNSLQADSLPIADPGMNLVGSIQVEYEQEFQGAELLLRRSLSRGCCQRWDLLAGYRFVQLDEELRIGHQAQFTGPWGIYQTGDSFSGSDRFSTGNTFHGLEMGVVYGKQSGPWSCELLAKLGLGGTRSRLTIAGEGTKTVTGVEQPVPGGLLAQQTNAGHYERDTFAVMPELGLTLGYQLSPRLKATVGYSFLYWSRVVRPAEQADQRLSQLPDETPTGALLPAASFVFSDFWAQGVNVGFEYVF